MSKYIKQDNFSRFQEEVNQQPKREQWIKDMMERASYGEKSGNLEAKLNNATERYGRIVEQNPRLVPNNEPVYTPQGGYNPANKANIAANAAMEARGFSGPVSRIRVGQNVWNEGGFNNTIAGEGGVAQPMAIAGAVLPIAVHYANQATHGEFNPLDIKSAGEGSEVEANHEQPYNSLRELYRQKKFEALK